MDILDEFTAVVYNTADLIAATSASYNFNYIYFNANITLSQGVPINPAKTSLTFDGLYEGNYFTLIDMNSIDAGSTIYVWTNSSIAITMRNLTIVGRNYYGVPYIREDTFVNNSAVSVTYENVNYSGIQLAFNPEGLTVFNNCNITITPPAGSTTAQEVGEVCRVEFAGTNVINHHSTSDAVFWFRGSAYSPSMRLRAGAHVTINSDNYFMYNLVPAGFPVTQNPVSYELLAGSTLLLTCNHGISLNSNHRVLSFHAAAGAMFRYIQLAANSTLESMYLNGNFTADADSSIYMQANYADSRPLIRFMNNASLALTNPRSFVLYSSASSALIANTNVTINFAFQCQQLNRWAAATAFPGAGTLEDNNRPQWRKTDWNLFTISGTITSAATANISSSFTAEELNNLPALNTLSLHNAAVIAVGNLPITMNPIVNDGRPITGWSSPNALIRIEYNVEGTDYLITPTADTSGFFTTTETEPIPAGSTVMIWANTPFLITFISQTVIVEGDLQIESAPLVIRFEIDPIVRAPRAILPREDFAEPVIVVDNRADESRWSLLLAIDGPMRTIEGNTIENGLIFTDDNGTSVLSGTPIAVYTSGPDPGSYSVFWGREQGVLLEVTEPIRSDLTYTAILLWSLQSLEN